MQVEKYPYEVVGQNTLIAHENKDYRQGDKIELPLSVAVNFRGQLKSLSEAGKIPEQEVDDVVRRTAAWRDHEKEGVLKARKDALEHELDRVDAELDKIAKNRATATKIGRASCRERECEPT